LNSPNNPSDIDELMEKGNALLISGRLDEAIKYYDRALAIDPNFKEALNGKGLALNRLGK
jgi:tetratricopeptide (TPR) repeat protein